jgi:sulfatase modifying factor 1
MEVCTNEEIRLMSFTIRLAVALIMISRAARVHAVDFDWATIGNPGNAPDVATGLGAVNYTYRISKHEVTNAQYAEFLNVVDPSGANADLGGTDGHLFHTGMSIDARGGINLNAGAANGLKFEVKPGRANNPVVFVSFFDAMRFANWLHNGQGNGDTETGAYAVSDGLSETRSTNSKFWIPSEDEWYKAAFHRNDGATGNYWQYSTKTDLPPFSDNPLALNAPDNSHVGNFFHNDFVTNGYDGGFALTNSTIYNDGQNYLTDVGAYTSTVGPYGTFDQEGNAREWNDSLTFLSGLNMRSIRGGGWTTVRDDLKTTTRAGGFPDLAGSPLGFRVANVPEPCSLPLIGMALSFLAIHRRSLNLRF